MRTISITLLLALCGCAPHFTPLTSKEMEQTVYGDEACYNALLTAPKAEVCRLKPSDKVVESSPEPTYEEGPRIELSGQQSLKLRTILANPATYSSMAKACIPRYGVRFVFLTGSDSVAVNLCFECNILEVMKNGLPVGDAHFDALRPELVALCKELFPSDAEIQKLKPSLY